MSDKEFKRHKDWDKIGWVIGYVDAYGAVHAQILFLGDGRTHGDIFPEAARYKLWRWSRLNGIESSIMTKEKATADDYHAIYDWLYKNGCLNNWELEDDD